MEERKGSLENMVIDPGFWENRKVFLTGHTGFKGGWLSIWLKNLGAKVTGFAIEPPTDPAIFNVAAIEHTLVKSIQQTNEASQ